MPFAMFRSYFPDLAERETRSFMVLDDSRLPAGSYGLIESYCDEPGCDCRRVFFSVFSMQSNQFEAVIGYGWESEAFYSQWLSHPDPDMVREMQGPGLNPLSPQSDHAPAILEMVRDVVLQDTAYVERLKAHYRMVRKEVDRPSKKRGMKARRKVKRKKGKRKRRR